MADELKLVFVDPVSVPNTVAEHLLAAHARTEARHEKPGPMQYEDAILELYRQNADNPPAAKAFMDRRHEYIADYTRYGRVTADHMLKYDAKYKNLDDEARRTNALALKEDLEKAGLITKKPRAPKPARPQRGGRGGGRGRGRGRGGYGYDNYQQYAYQPLDQPHYPDQGYQNQGYQQQVPFSPPATRSRGRGRGGRGQPVRGPQ
jgi:hypothetical protein